ncbi:MAG TPA: DUF488 domain-containing protein, partial [bacterium]|nr:DUF488 domain-containing protein [bacterium]
MEEFIDLLKFNGVERILDVRLLPGSRRYPHFNAEALRDFLAEAGIDYHHIAGLGGRRKASPDSKNLGWKNASFRGYADYMATEGFNRALNEAVALATERPSALLCAEAVPWRCHRSLIGDALLTRGWEVLDILGPGAAKPHRLTAFAKVDGERLS